MKRKNLIIGTTLAMLILADAIAWWSFTRPANNNPAAQTQTDTTPNDAVARGQGRVLSAFYGLDNGLLVTANAGFGVGASAKFLRSTTVDPRLNSVRMANETTRSR